MCSETSLLRNGLALSRQHHNVYLKINLEQTNELARPCGGFFNAREVG
jgi:hypothetical protein